MQIISLAGLIGKNAMTLASEQVPKSTQFVNSLQRKFIRSISRNIIQLLQQTAPDEVITVQKYLREIEKYGLTQGECKFLLSNDADILEKFQKSGHLKRTKTGWKLSVDGILLSNEVLCEFLD